MKIDGWEAVALNRNFGPNVRVSFDDTTIQVLVAKGALGESSFVFSFPNIEATVKRATELGCIFEQFCAAIDSLPKRPLEIEVHIEDPKGA